MPLIGGERQLGGGRNAAWEEAAEVSGRCDQQGLLCHELLVLQCHRLAVFLVEIES